MLFDPLTCASTTPENKRVSSGMELELYICRSIAQAHNGTIDVVSDGNETVFTVKIPRTSPPSSSV
ncbi:ATP-binding protein [Caballeronia sp. LZ003]|uniref:ATP-binding protein n=1 Tax=unclassified Caballeronia TaxID=2646786 RepID=UPI00385734B6